jgi:hypothetical protein
MGVLSNDRIIVDAGAYAGFLLARPEVTGSAIGTTGYCLGGRMSLLAAGGLGDTIAAAASFHGGRPARFLKRMRELRARSLRLGWHHRSTRSARHPLPRAVTGRTLWFRRCGRAPGSDPQPNTCRWRTPTSWLGSHRSRRLAAPRRAVEFV